MLLQFLKNTFFFFLIRHFVCCTIKGNSLVGFRMCIFENYFLGGVINNIEYSIAKSRFRFEKFTVFKVALHKYISIYCIINENWINECANIE